MKKTTKLWFHLFAHKSIPILRILPLHIKSIPTIGKSTLFYTYIILINGFVSHRRPRVESDYGYSTMTPNEDSEPNGSIYVDTPQINPAMKKKIDLLNISTSTTIGTASFVSNDDASTTLSSPSSTSSVAATAAIQIFEQGSFEAKIPGPLGLSPN